MEVENFSTEILEDIVASIDTIKKEIKKRK